MGPEQLGAEAVDEQDSDPADAVQRVGQPERIRRQSAAFDGDAERGGNPG